MDRQARVAASGTNRQPSTFRRHARRCSTSLRAASAAGDGRRQRKCVLIDWSSTLVEYTQGWDLQKQCLRRVQQFAEQGTEGHDYLVILQHQASFTLGAGSTEANLLFDISAPPLPVHRVERGGEVTYHGPGQLVLYPILDLQYHIQDLHWYLRTLEEVAIRALWEVSGLRGQRIEGLTGVWVDGCKVAAIGVRAQRWVTYHGLALNIDMDLAPFDMIVPCGISDRHVSMVSEMVVRQHGSCVGSARAELLDEYLFSLQQSFAEVFGVKLVSEDLTMPRTMAA